MNPIPPTFPLVAPGMRRGALGLCGAALALAAGATSLPPMDDADLVWHAYVVMGDIATPARPVSGNTHASFDGGKTWIRQQAVDASFGLVVAPH